jgi:hypothetical protein
MRQNNRRVIKLETALRPRAPHFLVAHSREEADKKILEFTKAHPDLTLPTVLIAEPSIKLKNSGTGHA